jgi:dTDP-4-amino-4,6-dideoxygalactose transaminase
MIHCAFPLAQYQSYKNEILESIIRVLDKGCYILGPEVEEFEANFAFYCDVDYAIGVNSGTDALILALRALDVGSGDEVITTSHTALATISAIINTGAKPVLVDIDPVHYTIAPECIQNAITAKTKVVIPVHLYGQPAEMDEIMKISEEAGLWVVEDCAQSIGAIYKGKKTGSIGNIGCFSFYPTKNLGAVGDGGMITTKDAKLALRIQRLRQYGWDRDRVTEEVGVNSRLDELQAAILKIKLKHLDEDNKSRREIANQYNMLLDELELVLPVESPETQHVYHQYVVACENRDQIKKQLSERKISAGIHYALPAHLHAGYAQRCMLPDAGLPVTEQTVKKILSLPIYPELAQDQVLQVISNLSKIL